VADADEPDLSLRAAGEEAVSRQERILSHLELTGLDVDGGNLASVVCFYQRSHLPLLKFAASPGVLFPAVTRSLYGHGSPRW
jgi:hypothetical protein